MPRTPLLLVALALGVISAGALVACGSNGGGSIPQANADSMLAALSQASAAEASEDCEAIQAAATSVADEAAGLPTTVDPEAREAITAGAENLFKLAGPDGVCGETSQTEKTTTKEKTTSTPTTTSTTEPTTTTTEPTTIPTQPPNEGGGGLGEGNSGGVPPDTGSGGTGGGN